MTAKRLSRLVKFRPPAIKAHAIAWAIFISFEVFLAGMIRRQFGHPLDYILHYLLYAWIFYFFCHSVLMPLIKDTGTELLKLAIWVLFLFALFYGINTLIYWSLTQFNIKVLWPADTYTAIFTNIYRFVFVVYGSVMYWQQRDRERKQKKLFRTLHAKSIAATDRERLRGDILEKELDLHRAQIHPHVLFNSLTFVYNEIRKPDPEIAEYVLSITDLMHYSISEPGKDRKISLNHEIGYIENTVSLYCRRMPVHVHLKMTGNPDDQMIMPLALVTLMENVFKHGDLRDARRPGTIDIEVRPGVVIMRTKNMIRKDPQPGHGIGMNNLRRRLDHYYPAAYSLVSGAKNNQYSVELTINLT